MLKNQLNSIKQLSPHVQTMLKTADAHVLLKTSVQLYTSSKKNSYCKTIVLARWARPYAAPLCTSPVAPHFHSV